MGTFWGISLKVRMGSFAFEGLGATRDFYKDVDKRNSIDDRGMRLEAFVHDDKNFQNAYWDGKVMVFGDGDGKLFLDFTKSLDVIAHGTHPWRDGIHRRVGVSQRIGRPQ